MAIDSSFKQTGYDKPNQLPVNNKKIVNGNLNEIKKDENIVVSKTPTEINTTNKTVDSLNTKDNFKIANFEPQNKTLNFDLKIGNKNSVHIKDKVENSFKSTNNFANNLNNKQIEIENKTVKYKEILENKKNEMTALTSNLNTHLNEYNLLINQNKDIGYKLIEYDNLLSKYELKRADLFSSNSNSNDVQLINLLSKIESLQINIDKSCIKTKYLENKIKYADKNLTSIKNKINDLNSEINVIKTEINNSINSLDGAYIASASSDSLSKLGGPVTILADKLIKLGLVAVNLYSSSVIYDNKIYSEEQSIKSKELMEKSKLLLKKIGEDYPNRVEKELKLTQKEKIRFKEEIHKLKKQEGRGGKDNLDLNTLKDLAKDIVNDRK